MASPMPANGTLTLSVTASCPAARQLRTSKRLRRRFDRYTSQARRCRLSRDHETVYPDDPSWPYFWLPKGIEAALLARCERQRVTYDQLLAEKLESRRFRGVRPLSWPAALQGGKPDTSAG